MKKRFFCAFCAMLILLLPAAASCKKPEQGGPAEMPAVELKAGFAFDLSDGADAYRSEDAAVAEVSEGRIIGVSAGETAVLALEGGVPVRRYPVSVARPETVSDLFDLSDYEAWRDGVGNPAPLALCDDESLKIHLGFHPEHQGNFAPLAAAGDVVCLRAKVNASAWAMLASCEDGKTHLAINVNTLETAIADRSGLRDRTAGALPEESSAVRKGAFFSLRADADGKGAALLDAAGNTMALLRLEKLAAVYPETEDFSLRLGLIAEKQSVISLAEETLSSEISDRYIGKTWLAVGDSITDWGVEYLAPVAKALGMADYRNAGIISACLSETSLADVSISVANRVKQGAFAGGDYGLITIFAGTNDFGWAVPQGGTDSTNTTTFAGAANFVLDYFLRTYPEADIVLLNCLYRAGAPGLAVYNETLAACAAKFSDRPRLHFFDLWSGSGIDASNAAELMYADGLHPNSEGYKKIAAYLVAQLGGIV